MLWLMERKDRLEDAKRHEEQLQIVKQRRERDEDRADLRLAHDQKLDQQRLEMDKQFAERRLEHDKKMAEQRLALEQDRSDRMLRLLESLTQQAIDDRRAADDRAAADRKVLTDAIARFTNAIDRSHRTSLRDGNANR